MVYIYGLQRGSTAAEAKLRIQSRAWKLSPLLGLYLNFQFTILMAPPNTIDLHIPSESMPPAMSPSDSSSGTRSDSPPPVSSLLSPVFIVALAYVVFRYLLIRCLCVLLNLSFCCFALCCVCQWCRIAV